MKRVNLLKFFSSLVLLLLMITIQQASGQTDAQKKKILFHVTQGPENPTRAALAFLVARTAVEEGHQVSLFLAGDAVQLIRNSVLDNISGLGTGKLREHYDIIVKGAVENFIFQVCLEKHEV